MNSLIKKLNTLVRASLSEVLGGGFTSPGVPRPISPERLGKGIDREIALLRQRINEALAYEDELNARVAALRAEQEAWDVRADEAVLASDDSAARHAVEQTTLTGQRLTVAESDLRDHQLAAQELMLRVNQLEAAVADSRRASEAETMPDSASGAEPSLSDVLRDMREKIAQMGDIISSRDELSEAPMESPPVTPQTIEDDLSARRKRLSRPE